MGHKSSLPSFGQLLSRLALMRSLLPTLPGSTLDKTLESPSSVSRSSKLRQPRGHASLLRTSLMCLSASWPRHHHFHTMTFGALVGSHRALASALSVSSTDALARRHRCALEASPLAKWWPTVRPSSRHPEAMPTMS